MSGEAKETRGEEGEVAIQEGDSVVLYGSRTRATIVPRVQKGSATQCEFGVFPHDSLIGRAFGSRVDAAPRRDGKPSGGWVWALRLTSELWSRFLPHRTQVLYSADIAMVVFNLHLAPGCVVVESGTGSGSLTFALAQAVGSEGKVYTFDFHEQRATEARAAFERLGVRNVVVSQADACNDGFLAPVDGADLRGKVDGVFLDLPSPWDAVKHADAVLKPGGMFCAFSPCIEQVQRTCLELVADSKFHSLSRNTPTTKKETSTTANNNKQQQTVVRTIECLERDFDIRKNPLPDVASSILEECRRPPAKRARQCNSNKEGDEEQERGDDGDEQQEEEGPRNVFLVKPTAEARGHTGFLTFACKTVRPAEPQAETTTTTTEGTEAPHAEK